MTVRTWYNERPYCPMHPVADNDELAEQCDRLMLYHNTQQRSSPEFRIAPKGELTAGWVIGLFVDGKHTPQS